MSELASLQAIIDAAFEQRTSIDSSTGRRPETPVERALDLLGEGKVRVADKSSGQWVTNQWLKKAVLLYFRLTPTHHPGRSRRRQLV